MSHRNFFPAFPHPETSGRCVCSVHQSPGPRLRAGPWKPLAGLFLTLEGSAIQLLEVTISLLASTVTVCLQEGSLVSERCSSHTGVGPPLGLAFLSARPSPWSHQGPRSPVAQCASSSAPHLPQVLPRAASQGHRHSKDAPSRPEAHGAREGGAAGEARPAVGEWWPPSLPSGGQAVTRRAAACRVQLRAGTCGAHPCRMSARGAALEKQRLQAGSERAPSALQGARPSSALRSSGRCPSPSLHILCFPRLLPFVANLRSGATPRRLPSETPPLHLTSPQWQPVSCPHDSDNSGIRSPSVVSSHWALGTGRRPFLLLCGILTRCLWGHFGIDPDFKDEETGSEGSSHLVSSRARTQTQVAGQELLCN